jgi:hypothetical protein
LIHLLSRHTSRDFSFKHFVLHMSRRLSSTPTVKNRRVIPQARGQAIFTLENPKARQKASRWRAPRKLSVREKIFHRFGRALPRGASPRARLVVCAAARGTLHSKCWQLVDNRSSLRQARLNFALPSELLIFPAARSEK